MTGQMGVRGLLLALIVVLSTLLLQTWAVHQQAGRAAHAQRELMLSTTRMSQERELRQLVEVAKTVIHRMADQPGDVQALQRHALAILAELDLGHNGYFFVYDAQGELMLDPAQMRLQGVDFCDPEANGSQQARQLLLTAQQGGGMVRYDWRHPASQTQAKKMSYVAPVGRWGWTIGTGIYENDAIQHFEAIGQQARKGLMRTFEITLIVGLITIFLVVAFSYGFHRHIFSTFNQKIAHLIQNEQKHQHHVARELHDGVLQVMSSAKYLLESAQLCAPPSHPPSKQQALMDRALRQLGMALVDVRHLAHGLHHNPLQHGLVPALSQLLDTARALGFKARLHVDGTADTLSQAMQLDLHRIAQEAVANAQAHSGGKRLDLHLRVGPRQVQLDVIDDGRGMHDAGAPQGGERGMGLRNMVERAAQHDGQVQWLDAPQGTHVRVQLPIASPSTPSV
ncbi:cache domain-containing protein [Comamonas serinivorans]|uniref:cache domain-containing protein n=1 Tax=Comamonas serinivorans TaxID=1082851 RepID=UPI00146D9020|nr:cache domain-containing protein [Comamonas serinivorans]